MFDAPKKCHLATGDRMSTLHELRLIAQTSVKSWAQGFYQENGDVVSDECFGDWMNESAERLHTFARRFKDDPSTVTLDEMYAAAKDLVDLIWKNKDTCAIQKQKDDFKVWCTDNEEACLLGAGLEERIVENSLDIVGTIVDLVSILEKDDTCYTSKEQLAEYSRLVKDLGQLSASASGFDMKWEQTNEVRHIKRSAFRTAVKGFYHRRHMTFREVIKYDFPELSEIVEDLFKALHEFLHRIKHEVKEVVEHIHHHI